MCWRRSEGAEEQGSREAGAQGSGGAEEQGSGGDMEVRRFFAADGAALRTIRSVLKEATEVRIATAYFAASGYQALQDVLQGKRVRLLIGRPEGGKTGCGKC